MIISALGLVDPKDPKFKGDAGAAQSEARACTSSCLDTCWAGPCIAVEPDGYFYGRVTPADLPEIVDAFASGTRVERLVLTPNDYVEPKELKKP